MMRALRKKMAIFLWVMVGAFVAFIFLQWGMNIMGRGSPSPGRETVAEVNGQPISYEQYRSFVTSFRRDEVDRLGVDRLDEATEAEIEKMAFDQLINEILWWQEIQRRGIRLTDEEVLAFIRSNPPWQLLEDTTLFTDGKFDPDKYLAAIADPRNLSWLKAYEREVRSKLPKQKLQLDLLSSVRLTDGELRRAYERRNQKIRVRYAFADPSHYLKEVSLDDGEVRDYYRANKQDFFQPKKVRLSYAAVEKTPSLEDELGVKGEIEELWRRVREGESFSELAEDFSEDPATRAEGGDLGFFGKGEMVKPFEEACFGLKVGQVSPPVKTPFGWHLIKVEGRKRTEVRARHILLRVFPSYETLERLRNRAEDFLKDAAATSLEEAAVTYGIEVARTSLFSREGDYIPEIGVSKAAAEFAFEAKLEELSEVVETPKGYFILKLIEKHEPRIASLEEVRKDAEQALVRERGRELALEEAKAVLKEVKSGRRLARAAADRSLDSRKTPLFALGELAPSVPEEQEFRGACSALVEEGVSGVVETERGFYIIELLERKPLDEEKVKEALPEFAQNLLQKEQQELLEGWFADLRSKAEPTIADYRHRFR